MPGKSSGMKTLSDGRSRRLLSMVVCLLIWPLFLTFSPGTLFPTPQIFMPCKHFSLTLTSSQLVALLITNLLSLLQVGFSRGPSRSKSQDAKESKKGSGRGWKTTRLRCSPDSKWGTERARRSGGSILSVMQFCECWQVHWRVCKADSYQRNTHFPSALTHCLGAACGKVGLGANTGRISKRSSWSPWSVTLPKFSDVKRALHGCHRQPPHYFQL